MIRAVARAVFQLLGALILMGTLILVALLAFGVGR